MSANGWLSTTLILIPIGGALLLWLLPIPRVWAGPAALLVCAAEIAFWIESLVRFDFDQGGLQQSSQLTWFDDLGVSYHVGMYQGFSVWLVGLTAIVMTAAIAYGYWAGRDKPRAYFGLMLFLTGAIVGVFTAQDLLVFYVFWEAMLIPLYVLIGAWGGPNRMRATITFVIYTMVGSLLMLGAVIVYGLQAGTFSMIDGGTNASSWIFLGFAAAFVVKAPVFPFHGWLPSAYRESPAEVSAVLSGVISKVAAFGFLRICFSLFPASVQDFRTPILVLAAIGLVYGSLLAFRAPDIRGVIAYSSLAQISLIMLGLFATNSLGIDGAVLQMVNHGLISATLFLLAGAVERRASTGQFASLGGMAKGRPALATVLMTTGVIALAVPGSAAFAGEFAILAGVFEQGWLYAVIGAVAIVLAAMYVLRLISAVLHSRTGSAVTDEAKDLRPAELLILVPLVALLLFLSAWPASISDRVVAAPTSTDTASNAFSGSAEVTLVYIPAECRVYTDPTLRLQCAEAKAK